MVLRTVTYNCRSLQNNIETVRDLCRSHDVIFLQETWLRPNELHILNSVHEDFCGFGTSSMNSSQPIRAGRPFGGIAFLWRRNMFAVAKPASYHDRILGLFIHCDNLSLFLLNVYLPCDLGTIDCLQVYVDLLGRLMGVIHAEDFDHVVIMGDFNANSLGSRFYAELRNACQDSDLVCADMQLLDNSLNYTYVSCANYATSWLDHCITGIDSVNQVIDCNILYDTVCEDHIPLSISWSFSINYVAHTPIHQEPESLVGVRVSWNNLKSAQKNGFSNFVSHALSTKGFDSALCSCDMGCKNPTHRNILSDHYDFFCKIITEATAIFLASNFQGNNSTFKPVPGWNNNVREYHLVARKAFLSWRLAGSPPTGPIFDSMRSSKRNFKSALRGCRADTVREEMSILELAWKCKDKPDLFWSKIRKHSARDRTFPSSINGASGTQNILRIWTQHYEHLLNTGDIPARDDAPYECSPEQWSPFTVAEVRDAIADLSPGKAPGLDCISAEHIKLLGPPATVWICLLLNSFVQHCYLPDFFLKTVILPIQKSKISDNTVTSNYRGIALPSILSKLLENLILKRTRQFLCSSKSQFGFTQGVSSLDAVCLLKETVRHYTTKGSRVYAAFLDLRQAFDKVNFDLLFSKLKHAGVPCVLLSLLQFWYKHQTCAVKWDNQLGDWFKVSNGVRQGGVLSPLFFNVYIDQLLQQLQNSKFGCMIGGEKIACLAYADDLVLLSPTRSGLQCLLNFAEYWARSSCMAFNVQKSNLLVFLSRQDKSCPLVYPVTLYQQALPRVDTVRYLGIILTSTLRDDQDILRARNAFLASFNSVYFKFSGMKSYVLCALFQIFCCSFYGSSLWVCYNLGTLHSLSVQYHFAIKRIARVSSRARNHATCTSLGILTFDLLRGYAFIGFYSRMVANVKLSSLVSRGCVWPVPLYSEYCRIRKSLDLINCDLAYSTKNDIRNHLFWLCRMYSLEA